MASSAPASAEPDRSSSDDDVVVGVVGYMGDPSRLRPPSKDQFQCQEQRIVIDDEEEEDIDIFGTKVVAFESTIRLLPSDTEESTTTTKRSLVFYCREPSCGVLTQEEPSAILKEEEEEEEEDNMVDPSFFDPGYTLAGKTGFQVWPGSRLVVESLVVPQPQIDCQNSKLQALQLAVAQGGIRILELGSGVGLVGASLAQAGAQVLLTDLPTLVTESLLPNLQRNANSTTTQDETDQNDITPTWFSSPQNEGDDDDESSIAPTVFPIGKGWVSATALDWTIPVSQQLTEEQCQVDWIIASDCVWLVTMLDGLLSSVQSIFDAATNTQRKPKLLMSFQRRDPKDANTNESTMFTTVDRVLTEIQIKRKWKIDCLAWHPVVYETEDGKLDDSKEVFLFLIEPS